MARLPECIDNTDLCAYLQEYMTYDELPPNVKNFFEIASYARGPNTRASSTNALFRALQTMHNLTSDGAAEFVNRKNRLFGDPDYSRAHHFAFYARLKAARSMIKYHIFP